ncbi:hypothetical protein A2641_03560 [Candidatus Nomurabacteria bacterium RIFCSPHIGHO2_01_FULL_37_25]|uniref:D-alanine--D-alanine ligase C-terminal domain-containing protein n=1 Tax=Candidatus Nomurabacteria bacterium RIFCSPLOWO2_01_FULL_36_16 TaxID=1801767 RepID=A0A1F6X057_9BACT|nr:MAG: hypothetical protein A2641_03560 [Candidatus Nomurabacteria bacterium RIFCSPHIGHO2_01_FULL_37_25]OGI75566.1 MAG: hypothetical protein A3D36_03205 [Candidatus Nomurabacteria bacterium RIFCSPHIGHO2_02_FULL_36_29]OGI87404.1 MAG: hypothetical protein A3A91_02825 [Candidatus Nomurabacteria bacterium RIFCSPLOWO2_01_FULL_36_16]
MDKNNKRRIGILRGGGGDYYQSSLNNGGVIIAHIVENLADKYKISDILVGQDDIWHHNGIPINPSDLVNKVDIVWNTTHPSFSNILNSLSISNVSQESFSSALQNSKEMLREHIKSIGLSIPRSIFFKKAIGRSPMGEAKEVFAKFGAPWIIKTFNEVKLAKTFNELVDAINGKDNTIVEEFITGKVASVHSVAGFRGEDLYTFPPINIFGDLSLSEKEKLVTLTKDLHNHIGAKHYLKSNFLLNSRGKIYLLDFESMPNLKSHSHFAQACESVGVKMHHVVEHILERF